MTHSDWPTLLADYRRSEKARGHRDETIRTRMSYLNRWAAEHEPAATSDEVVAWLARDDWAPSTRKSARGALRSFYRWARKAGRIANDPTLDLDPVKVPQHLPRPASEEQVAEGVASSCRDSALMVRLAANCGLRRSEIAQLRRDDLDDMGRLLVHGKGGKQRLVPVLPVIAAEIRTRPPGFLFPGRFTGHIHPSTVAKWTRQASGSSPHPFRHRFATRAYSGTKNLRGVQEALGHSSPDTTKVYIQLADDALLDVMWAAA
jgi:integrase/recombinase XerC